MNHESTPGHPPDSTTRSAGPDPGRPAGLPEPTVELQYLAMPLILVGIWLFFTAINPQFASPRNLSMLMIEVSVTATLAFGMLLVIVSGHIDLAAGSGVGLIGGIAAVLVFRYAWPSPLAMLAGLLSAILIWALMGLSIVRLRIQAFVVTLGGLLILKGLFWLVIESSTVPVVVGGSQNFFSSLTTVYLSPLASFIVMIVVAFALAYFVVTERAERQRAGLAVVSAELLFLKGMVAVQGLLLIVLVCNRFRGVPASFLILCAFALAAHQLVTHTAFGRYLYAIGGNEAAAHACGVPVERSVVIAFGLMGVCVAVTGFLQTAYAGASTTTVGELMELDAIAACVIGGASLKGGRGTILGTLLGSLVMASLLNGMTLLAVPPELKLIVRGVVLVLAVLMDVRLRRQPG